MRHGPLVQQVLIHATQIGWRLFKNAVGSAWHGIVTEEHMVSDKKGDQKVIELWKAHLFTYGLRTGSSDLVGWRTFKITEAMVGKRVAQFCAVECKTGQYATLTDEQINFLQQVKKAGGHALIARIGSDGKVNFEEVEG